MCLCAELNIINTPLTGLNARSGATSGFGKFANPCEGPEKRETTYIRE